MKLEGERLGAQESVSKYLQYEMGGQPCLRGVAGFFIAPKRSSRWGVRNPGMSRSGAEHIRPTSLEADLGTGYVRSGT
jgi:hypothetical protein